MVVSANMLKWAMRLYPPLLFQRIWVIRFKKDFTGTTVKIKKSILNKNYNGSIFGGTIFAAVDPFYPVLFHQIFNAGKKRKLKIWSKSARINFLKPALSDLFFDIIITEMDIAYADKALKTMGKYENTFQIEVYNDQGDICASLLNEVYLRDMDFTEKSIN
ncbi:DUF4442 domain-containing protein [Mucilaginibacter sp. SD-g]|uniref:DUF4442 domain-containing protein n=2 Tax=Mucilaginibacter segetis TaxID=2793071 RepID=A0A934UMX2_9SPHI|nr:hotdog fold domain-containing protein [Mucilaginibacter segetis]MBK0379465.1 DUF4442 domain-containing protein [Mucilaginibacter segetis]